MLDLKFDLIHTSARQLVFLGFSSEPAPPASSAARLGTLAATPVKLAGAPVSADRPEAAAAECAGLAPPPPPDRPKREENQLGRRPVSCMITPSMHTLSMVYKRHFL